jgi:hypothetical protein
MHESLAEGTRVGQFVVLRDIDGRTHAVAAGAVAAICETDDGALLMLPGGSSGARAAAAGVGAGVAGHRRKAAALRRPIRL